VLAAAVGAAGDVQTHVLLLDHAVAAPPKVLADLAAQAEQSQASLLLLDPGENRWPPS